MVPTPSSYQIGFSPDGKRIATRDEQKIRLFDETGEYITSPRGASEPSSFGFLPDNRLIVSVFDPKASASAGIIYDSATGKRLGSLDLGTFEIRAVMPSGQLLLADRPRGLFRLVNPDTRAVVYEMFVHPRGLPLTVAPDGRHALSDHTNDCFYLWRLPIGGK